MLGVLQYRWNIFIGYRNDTGGVGVNITKDDAKGADLLTSLEGRDKGLDGNGRLYLSLDNALNGSKLLGREGTTPGKVKGKLVDVTERALLADGLVGDISVSLGY